MNPLTAYQQRQALGLTRIDLLLALADGAIDRLDQAAAAFARDDHAAATPLLLRSQRIVAELAAGLDFRYGELPRNLSALYSFVLRAIARGNLANVNAALRVLRPLRDGFTGIRAEAIQLERTGAIPARELVHSVVATA